MVNEAGDASGNMEVGRHFHVPAKFLASFKGLVQLGLRPLILLLRAFICV